MKKNLFLIVFLVFASSSFLFTSNNFRIGGENGEFWRVGNEVNIYWNSEMLGSELVNIYLWDKLETKLKVLSLEVNNNGKYLWQIPDSLVDGFYKIKIIPLSQSKNYIISDNYFKIYERLNVAEENHTSYYNPVPTIFPNPASSTTTIKLNDELNGKISAVDLLGNETLVWSGFAPTGDLELDVSGLPIGIYTILINSGYKTEALKMIKE